MAKIDIKCVVAHKISIARSELNLNQSQFGELIDVGQGEVAKLESGQNNTTIETIQRIAEKTNKPFFWFFQPMPNVNYSGDCGKKKDGLPKMRGGRVA